MIPIACTDYSPAFLDLVRESYFDELADMQFYADLANMAPNQDVRQIIVSIVGDEYGHARTFASILALPAPTIVTGQASPPVFQTFKEGLELAAQGEIHATARYAEMAMLAPCQTLSLILLNIAGDEYEHEKIWETIKILDP